MDAVQPMQIEADLDRIIDGLPLVASRLEGEVIILTLVAEREHPLLGTLGGEGVAVLVMGRPEEWSVEVVEEVGW